jgi:hypothetical protein
MGVTKQGAQKIAAKRIGLPFDEYLKKLNNGLKWCYKCRVWKLQVVFDIDKSRGDGLASACVDCRRVKVRMRHKVFPATQQEKTIAIEAVRTAIRRKRLIAPKYLPCLDCGKQARVYHHHLGYARAHVLDIHALCYSCHKYRHQE